MTYSTGPDSVRQLQKVPDGFGETTQYNGHYAVQGHLRSPISIAIESPYATSY